MVVSKHKKMERYVKQLMLPDGGLTRLKFSLAKKPILDYIEEQKTIEKRIKKLINDYEKTLEWLKSAPVPSADVKRNIENLEDLINKLENILTGEDDKDD